MTTHEPLRALIAHIDSHPTYEWLRELDVPGDIATWIEELRCLAKAALAVLYAAPESPQPRLGDGSEGSAEPEIPRLGEPRMAPPQHIIEHAIAVASMSPCRSQRGVVVYDPVTNVVHGAGYNGPPTGCPGRGTCAGICGQLSVHAEMRALREAGREAGRRGGMWPQFELVHVERVERVVTSVRPCDGPTCSQCSKEILDVGFVGGVWLYEQHAPSTPTLAAFARRNFSTWPSWRRYDVAEFHARSLEARARLADKLVDAASCDAGIRISEYLRRQAANFDVAGEHEATHPRPRGRVVGALMVLAERIRRGDWREDPK